MAVKDHENHYEGLRESGSVVPTPNTVSRSLKVGERAFQTTVWQSGKPVLDSELQLGQDASWWENYGLRRWQVPSGWLRGQTRYDAYCDWITETAPSGLVDNTHEGSIGDSVGTSVGGSIGSDDAGILPDGTLINCLVLPRLEAIVAGRHVVVEYTYTETDGYNIVTLPAPQVYDGTSGTVKRTDFVFLECWLALVAPSPKASGSVQVADSSALVAGDKITINGIDLTATAGAPGLNEFQIVSGDDTTTATNIANAINSAANSFTGVVTANANLDTVTIKAATPGAGSVGPPRTGNFITLAVTTAVVGSLAVSGPTLTGGADRPAKPATHQDRIYRHGNVLSPLHTWLLDEIVDSAIDSESTQRVQLQYRIRSTGTSEAVNYKKHPDGFSNTIAGPPSSPSIFAQGGRSTPASNVSGRYYPFVQADKSKVWGNSSAPAYDIEDDGLWVAGNGSEQSAKDLGTLDGFVYAIPLAFVFRHNDVSSTLAGFKGFDPVNNANGAPRYQHGGYNGPLGPIPAGKSDRPDKHFCDVLTQENLLDLRRHVIFPGVDTASELQYQIQSLLDGSLRTWQVDTASKQDLGGDSGDVSTRMLICDEIGRSSAKGGNNVTSGDTQRGVFIRNFDHVSRRYADQSIVERVVFSFWPGDRDGVPVPPGLDNPGKYVEKMGGSPGDSWYEGDILHLNLEELDATTLGGIFQGLDGGGSSGGGLVDPTMGDFAPLGTVITDVLSIYHDDGHYTSAVDQEVQASVIQGLGTQHLTIELDANDRVVTGGVPSPPNPTYQMVGRSGGTYVGSDRRIFVEVELTFPIGEGTTDTPDHEVDPDPDVYDGAGMPGPGPVIENDTTQRPNDFEALLEPVYRQGYREVHLEYVANDTTGHNPGDRNAGTPVGQVHPEYLVSRDQFNLIFPRRVYGTGSGSLANQTSVTDQVTANPATVDESLTEFGSSSRNVVLEATSPLSGAGQTLCAIKYFPQDPIPNYGILGGGYQVSVYFRTDAPQTAGVKEGDIGTSGDGVIPTTLNVEPLMMGMNVWSGQVGMGSVDLSFPYVAPLDQIPIRDEIVTTKEWYFCATADITVDDFNAETGLLALHPFVPSDSQEVMTFGGTNNWKKPTKDAEFRALYPYADETKYRPTVMSQPLYGATRHKVFASFLARATEDVPGVEGGLLFRKNELLLIVLSRFAELDDDNTVRFTDPPADNRTCAAVYRTRNMLLLVGGKVC